MAAARRRPRWSAPGRRVRAADACLPSKRGTSSHRSRMPWQLAR